jgi:hypothetical protein
MFVSGSNIHPNPHFYKYYWWIYAHDSVYENGDAVFYKEEHRLNTYDAMMKMKELRANKIPFAYVNMQIHRFGCSIWNYEQIKEKFPEEEFAPRYEDDTDPEWKGHK